MAREKLIQIRLDEDEKAKINRRARAAGVDRSTYLRELGLGERRVGASIEIAKPEPSALQEAEASIERADRTAATRAPDFRTDAEIAEAKMDDAAAKEAFLERRTRELRGQGHTTPVARRKAAEEWETR